MNASVEPTAIALPAAGSAKSSYYLFSEDLGNEEIWPFVGRILAAAGQPVRDNVAADLSSEGYAFGPIRNLAQVPIEFDDMGRTTFVFVRDPRDAIAARWISHEPKDIVQFVRIQSISALVQRYRQIANFCRQRRHVRIVRLEDVRWGWHRLAFELVEALNLDLPLNAAYAIAKDTDIVGPAAPGTSYRECFDGPALATLEETSADILAFFGYVPQQAPSPIFEKNIGEFLRAASERLSAGRAEPAIEESPAPPAAEPGSGSEPPAPAALPIRPYRLWEPDPELYSRLKRNASCEVSVLGRRFSIDVDAGCRVVVGQPATGEKTLAVYGCSFTFGSGLPNDETFCSVLQSAFPSWRVENHGNTGYSTVQNLIQLRRNSQWGGADFVTFCWMPLHAKRNVAEISWIRQQQVPQARNVKPRPFPRGTLGPDGELEIRYVNSLRWDLDGVDLDDFQLEDHYMDLVTAAVFRRAQALVAETGGHFFVTILWGALSPALRRMLDDAGIPVVNASVQGREYTLLPDDGHPNGLANRLYAERIGDYLVAKATA